MIACIWIVSFLFCWLVSFEVALLLSVLCMLVSSDFTFLLLWREMRFHYKGHWIWFIRIVMSMWLYSSMHHGALSQGCLSQHFLFWLLCILPSHILRSKNQPSGQGWFILTCTDAHRHTHKCLFTFFISCYLLLRLNWLLQYTLQVWSSWLSFSFHFEFYNASSIPGCPDSWFSYCIL